MARSKRRGGEGGGPVAAATGTEFVLYQTDDGLVIVTPEYNRGLPAVTKNAVDWGSRPRGRNSWAGKPVAIVGASDGRLGTASAQAHLRSIVPAIGALLMGSPEIYFQWKADGVDETGALTDPKSNELLGKFLDRFADWIERVGANG